MAKVDEISTAPAPFDNPVCDIILRSIDGVNFRVFKLILALVSPMFKHMFTLPEDKSQSDVPVIPVEENSATLEALLLICYPATTPALFSFDSLDVAKAVLESASKYEMEAVLSRAGDLVIAQFLPTNPLDLYALSCKFGWQHHAQTAATKTLEIKDLGRPSREFAEMRNITAIDYHKLLIYHHSCGVAAESVGTTLSWLHPSIINPLLNCHQCIKTKTAGMSYVPLWVHEYLVSSGTELFARPCESTLRESTSYDRAIIKACNTCRSANNCERMNAFRTFYIAKVKKVLADARLTTEDCLIDDH